MPFATATVRRGGRTRFAAPSHENQENFTSEDSLPARRLRDRFGLESIDDVWQSYKRNPSRADRDRLIEYYMTHHVRRIAERMHAQLPKQVDVDDLIQQGYLGLVESIERFDPARNVKFETFSGRRIFGAMRDYLRSIDPMPRLSRIREKRIACVTERFRKEFGREPDEQELCDRLDMSVPRFRRIMGGDRPPLMVHFNAARPEGDSLEDSDGMRGFEDRAGSTPDINAEHDDLRRWITTGFSRRDRLIIILYYYERMTMKEIGRSLGISESRVSQRLDSILLCLRSRLCHQRAALLEFYFSR
jgi:RNA polymerase sigma factor for flagellar operon FliA